jgi:ectoine hydroxylase-related dioxygenase (phytanoyl-CoA dioxygenase family)
MAKSLVRTVTGDEIEAYRSDGVVCLRGVFDASRIERLRRAVDDVIAEPGPPAIGSKSPCGTETILRDRFMWTFNDEFRDFALGSHAALIAGALMVSRKVNLFFDHLAVNNPGGRSAPSWRHDQSLWCIEGWQACSMWLPLDGVDRCDGANEYVRGSHRWDGQFADRNLNFGDQFGYEDDMDCPNVEEDRDAFDILSWDAEPGDCIVHHALTVYDAPSNRGTSRCRSLTTRWAGDDAVYAERKGMTRPLRDPGLKVGDRLDSDLFPVVWRASAGEHWAPVHGRLL